MQLHFYRDNNGREVDLVIETNSGDVAAVQVKSSTTVGRSDAGGLRLLREKLGSRFKCGVVLYCGEHTYGFDERIWAMPVEGLWSV